MSKNCNNKLTAKDFQEIQKVIDESCSFVRANETRIWVGQSVYDKYKEALEAEGKSILIAGDRGVGKTAAMIDSLSALPENSVVFSTAGIPIIRVFKGYVVYAQSESDYKNKCRKISRGDTNGFIKENQSSRKY